MDVSGWREMTLYGTENIFNPNKYITTVRGTITSNDIQHMPHCYMLIEMMIILLSSIEMYYNNLLVKTLYMFMIEILLYSNNAIIKPLPDSMFYISF